MTSRCCALVIALALVWAGCDQTAEKICSDPVMTNNDPAYVVANHRGSFLCIDESQFDEQRTLLFDGNGQLVNKDQKADFTSLGTYVYSGGNITMNDSSGWSEIGTDLLIDKGRLLRFAMGSYDCFAMGLWGTCPITGKFYCNDIDDAGDTYTYDLELFGDRGVLIHEGSSLEDRWDRGVYIVSQGVNLTLIQPREKFAPRLPYEMSAELKEDGALVLANTSAGEIYCLPQPPQEP